MDTANTGNHNRKNQSTRVFWVTGTCETSFCSVTRKLELILLLIAAPLHSDGDGYGALLEPGTYLEC